MPSWRHSVPDRPSRIHPQQDSWPPSYFPDRFDWQHKKPEEVGMDAGRLDDAVKHAIASENPATKDLTLYLATTMGATEPFDSDNEMVEVRRLLEITDWRLSLCVT